MQTFSSVVTIGGCLFSFLALSHMLQYFINVIRIFEENLIFKKIIWMIQFIVIEITCQIILLGYKIHNAQRLIMWN